MKGQSFGDNTGKSKWFPAFFIARAGVEIPASLTAQ
jgi:hypothetical protein